MGQSYTCLRYHFIFGTKRRQPLIDAAFRERLYRYLGGIVRSARGRLLCVGGMPDHVHLLVSSHQQIAVSDFLRDLKANSSKWIHEVFPEHARFGWQDGYGAFTVSASRVPGLEQYIRGQETHHRTMIFEEEFMLFLKRHGIPFDPKKLWGDES